MTLDISHPLYVVAAKYADSDGPLGWQPYETRCYLHQEVAEAEAAHMASHHFECDQFAVIEYGASEPRIVGDIQYGVRQEVAPVEESSGPEM